MNGLPLPASLKRPGVMLMAELAACARIGTNTVSQLVTQFGIQGLAANAKIKTAEVFA